MAAVIDVDGTLIDSNYQHVLAWQRAFAAAGFHVPCARIHRTIGIGSDRFVAAACDEAAEREHGDALRDAHSEQYEKLIDEAGPLPDAHELLAALRERDVAVVLASSATREELDHYVEQLDAAELIQAAVSAGDVDTTKPAPDVIQAALGQIDADEAIMIGDSRWDCEAAGRAGVPPVGVLTGGWSRGELREAGAVEVFEDLGAICSHLGEVLGHARHPRPDAA